jgi:squalene-hopene/tetraprenyl-beta-curcumene cyclase
VTTATASHSRIAAAHHAAAAHLLARLKPEGYWEGQLSSSALSTATAMSALAVAGCLEDVPLLAGGAAWLAHTQNSDGGWGDTTDSPSNLATTLLSLSALVLTERASGGLPAAAGPARRAAEEYVACHAGAKPEERVAAIRRRYGADRTFAVPILMNGALAGLVPWPAIPGLPFELAALPRGLYPALRLHVVSYALPALIAIGVLLARRNPAPNPLARALRSQWRCGSWKRCSRGTAASWKPRRSPPSWR